MNTMTSPRGPLPARVYWTRRGLVLFVALLLVFGVGKVLSGFGGNDSGATATTAAHKGAPSQQPTSAPPASTTGQATTQAKRPKATSTALPASAPTGPCDPAKITVTPSGGNVIGGRTSAISLVLTTSAQACTWRVSAKSLVLKINSGSDRIWTSQDCAAAIKTTDVVVRPQGEQQAKVAVEWSGRRSATDCPSGTAWADPGYYHAIAATMGGNPTDVQFQVVKPPRPTVTKTAHPKQKKAGTKTPAKKSTKR